eukprot:TRINITY_DN38289_c0_g1_i1.p1 TRINITY_DN38289_c0_g1~~TRINITY_DN38289_c0_g1_i1.p1  ORF type:complete len:230 (+),score=32.17 TRINITY_DN38289_c0_g1_i1:260-949(+)
MTTTSSKKKKGPPPQITCSVPDCTYSTPEDCPTWDLMKKYLEVHVVNVHPPPPQSFICDVCAKSFDNKRAFKAHSNLHEKNFSCKICKKKFPRSDNLRRHMLTHTLEKPYLCAICTKSFTQSAHLKDHSLLHSDKSFSCEICAKAFAQPRALKRHRLIHSSSVIRFHCQECEFSSKRSDTLTDHMNKQHPTERPHQCKMCSKAFSLAGSLKRHLLSGCISPEISSLSHN